MTEGLLNAGSEGTTGAGVTEAPTIEPPAVREKTPAELQREVAWRVWQRAGSAVYPGTPLPTWNSYERVEYLARAYMSDSQQAYFDGHAGGVTVRALQILEGVCGSVEASQARADLESLIAEDKADNDPNPVLRQSTDAQRILSTLSTKLTTASPNALRLIGKLIKGEKDETMPNGARAPINPDRLFRELVLEGVPLPDCRLAFDAASVLAGAG